MANWGVKGQTFAPFAFLLYLCIVFRIVEQASSTPYVQKNSVSAKKQQFICVCQIFVVILQHLFSGKEGIYHLW